MYKLHNIQTPNGLHKFVVRVDTDTAIPFDPANTDYQAYLVWLAEGNEPLPAEEQGEQA